MPILSSSFLIAGDSRVDRIMPDSYKEERRRRECVNKGKREEQQKEGCERREGDVSKEGRGRQIKRH